MIRLLIDGLAVDLAANASVSVKRRSPAYLGEKAEVIPGDYTFPFTLPLTAKNRRALRYPQRLDNQEPLPTELPAQLYVGPDLLLNGRVKVQRATARTADVFLYRNPLAKLSDVLLNETEQGTVGAGSASELAALMKATTSAPLDHDAIFAPVYNAGLNEAPDVRVGAHTFMNSWHYDQQRFMTEYHVSPLPRLEPVLRRAIEGAGYSWDDGLHTTDEMKRQVLVTNRSLQYEGKLTPRGALASCLPPTSLSDLLKSLCRTYCLAPFSDLTGNHLRLQRLGPLAARLPRYDWTAHASHAYERSPDGATVKRYEWGEGAYADSYHLGRWGGTHDATTAEIRDTLKVGGGFEEGLDPRRLYYLYGKSAVSKYVSIPDLTFWNVTGLDTLNSFGFHANPGDGETISPELTPCQTQRVYGIPSGQDSSVLPTLSDKPLGISGYNSFTGQVTSEEGDITARLSFYRGLQPSRQGQLYPMVNHNNSDANHTPIDGERESLNWQGPDGLYQRHWRDWDEMLQRAATVKRSFLLPLAQLLDFDFRDKVRVENRNYFVREMEFTVTQRGVSPTACTLIAVT